MALHTSTTFIHIVTNSLTVPQNHVSPRTWMTFNKEPLREYRSSLLLAICVCKCASLSSELLYFILCLPDTCIFTGE